MTEAEQQMVEALHDRETRLTQLNARITALAPSLTCLEQRLPGCGQLTAYPESTGYYFPFCPACGWTFTERTVVRP
jgi:hypothetical protein